MPGSTKQPETSDAARVVNGYYRTGLAYYCRKMRFHWAPGGTDRLGFVVMRTIKARGKKT